MSSKMQSPESFEDESFSTSDGCQITGIELQLQYSDAFSEENSYEPTEAEALQRRFASIISDSPLCRDLEGQTEISWSERLGLPILSDFDKYEGEPPSCSAYETIVSEGMNDEMESVGNDRNFCLYDERCNSEEGKQEDKLQHTEDEKDREEDQNINEMIKQQGTSTYDTCLEWPTIQQEALSFNELSDVIADSYRLNKENSLLMKILDDSSSTTAAVASVGPDNAPKSLLDVANQHIPLNNSLALASQQDQTHEATPGQLPVSSWSVSHNVDGSHNTDQKPSSCISSTNQLKRDQLAHYAPNIDLKSIIACHRNRFFEMEYESKMERQFRRKEKNRECSRNFRYKQRLKEDCMKRGKLEKEVNLRSLLFERERLKSALMELAKNCASCPKAMEFLSPFNETSNKENMPGIIHETVKLQNPAK